MSETEQRLTNNQLLEPALAVALLVGIQDDEALALREMQRGENSISTRENVSRVSASYGPMGGGWNNKGW